MKKRIIAIVLACILLLLEALPIGAALHIPNAEGHTELFCSFFDLRPFADGNFAPFIVALLSVALLILCLIYCLKPKKQLKKTVFGVACAAMLLAFCPLLYCMQCYSFIDCLIVFILFIHTMMFVEQTK